MTLYIRPEDKATLTFGVRWTTGDGQEVITPTRGALDVARSEALKLVNSRGCSVEVVVIKTSHEVVEVRERINVEFVEGGPTEPDLLGKKV